METLEKFEVTFEESNKCNKWEMTEGMRVRAITNKIQNNEDAVATFWMKMEQQENFEDYAVYTVEIPAKEQNTPEVDEAKHKEIENLIKFDVFEEVDDCGQERISSRWVITEKQKSDGQKSQIKGRIVAKGYQEGKKPQSDSPALLRESLKMYFALAANEGFRLRSIDIRVAFLQAKV